MELKNRNEMSPEFQWNLADIFPDRAAWEAAYQEAQTAVGTLGELRGRLAASKEALREVLDTVYAVQYKVEMVYLYASLRKNGDNGDPESQEMEGRAVRLYMNLSAAIAFLTPEILALDAETFRAWLESDTLAGYRHILEDIGRNRAHTLDEPREQMLALLSDAAGTASNAFDMLESVDMTFPSIRDENGEEVMLTHGNFGVYRESADVRVRRDSFEQYFGTYKKYINTLAALYSGSVKMDSFHARVRGFESAREAALFSGNIPVSVYDSLVSVIHESLPILHRYLKLRREVLGLDELHMYDLYCPMVKQDESRVDFETAKQMVLNATKPLGERYEELLHRAFSERWIDVYENKGKTTGAFSCGVYSVHPYVLLNYTDTLEDAFTLAHELGHSMHSFFSSEKQDYANNDYRIFVAEVASTVNEVLLTMSLLQSETDKKRRAYLLNHFLEGFRTTVFRQTLFAEFEHKSHAMYEAGETLTAQALNKVYRELNEEYYKGAVVDELQDIEWARIPHFYNAFYVYQYATGFCSAVAIANRILKENGAGDYLRFLSTGGSDYPLEELKIAGVDLTTPAPIRSAMEVFDRTLGELETLLREGV